MMKSKIICAIAASAMVAMSYGADYTWNGNTGDGNWSNSLNWANGEIPVDYLTSGTHSDGLSFQNKSDDKVLFSGATAPSVNVPGLGGGWNQTSDTPLLDIQSGGTFNFTMTSRDFAIWRTATTADDTVWTIGDGLGSDDAMVTISGLKMINRNDNATTTEIVVNSDGTLTLDTDLRFTYSGTRYAKITINGGAVILNANLTDLGSAAGNYVDFTATGGSFTANYGGTMTDMNAVATTYAAAWHNNSAGILEFIDNGTSFTVRTVYSPVISEFNVSTNSGRAPVEVIFDGSGSSADSGIASYGWDFGDGNTASGVLVTNTYTAEGSYSATLTITDNDSNTASNSVDISVTAAVEAVINVSTNSGFAPVEVVFDGSGSSTSGDSITSYAWDFGDGNTASGVLATNTYTVDATYTAMLTVTDIDSNTASNSVEIQLGVPTYDIGTVATITFDSATELLSNTGGITDWTTDTLNINDGSDLSNVDFTALGIDAWSSTTFGSSVETIWDGANLSGLNLSFTLNNFGYNDSMVGTDFSGSTITTKGNQPFLFVDAEGADFSGATFNIPNTGNATFRKNGVADTRTTIRNADFSDITWGVALDNSGGTDFFSVGPGTTSAADKDFAADFSGANLTLITGNAKTNMIANLGAFDPTDGTTPIGAKYDDLTLSNSGWTSTELDAAGWQYISSIPDEPVIVLDGMTMSWDTPWEITYEIQSRTSLSVGGEEAWATFDTVVGTPPTTTYEMPVDEADVQFFQVIIQP